jgi:hypothetical protein
MRVFAQAISLVRQPQRRSSPGIVAPDSACHAGGPAADPSLLRAPDATVSRECQ